MFPDYYDKTYFQGLTSEAMTEEIYRGERRIVFKKNTDVANEPTDCRTYCIGAAEIAGWSRLNKEGWDNIRRELGLLEPERKSAGTSKKKKKVTMNV